MVIVCPSLSGFSLPPISCIVFFVVIAGKFWVVMRLSREKKTEAFFGIGTVMFFVSNSLPNSLSLQLSHRLDAPILFPSGVAQAVAPSGAACSPSAVPSSSAA